MPSKVVLRSWGLLSGLMGRLGGCGCNRNSCWLAQGLDTSEEFALRRLELLDGEQALLVQCPKPFKLLRDI